MKDIPQGTRLTLRPEKTIEENPDFELVSILEAHSSDGSISFREPVYLSQAYILSPNDVLFVSYVDELARYDFQCVVRSRKEQGGLPLVSACVVGDVIVTQRRDDFRVRVTTPRRAVIRMKGADGGTVMTECLLSDISNGGIALCVKDEYDVGEDVTISIQLGNEKEMTMVQAEVRWCGKSGRRDYGYRIGARFGDADLEDKNKIKKYVAHLQRQFLQGRAFR